MPGQLGRRLRRTVPAQVRRRRADDAAHAADLAGDEVGLRHRTNPDRQVEAVLDQIDLAVAERNIQLHLRVGLGVGADDRGKLVLPVRQRDRYLEHALGHARHVAGDAFGLVDIHHDLGAALIELAAGFSEAEPARRAIEQARAEMFFQLLNLLGSHRPGNIQLACGCREAAALDHSHVHFHCRKQIHGV